jgi:transposase-like protein
MDQSTSAVSKLNQKPAREDAASRWRKLIEQQRESGLSVSVYCRERGISAASLFAWRRRLRPASSLPGAQMFKPVKLLTESKQRAADDADPVVIESPAASFIELPAASFIELCLPGERRLIVRRGFDRGLLLDLLDALEPKSSRLESRS